MQTIRGETRLRSAFLAGVLLLLSSLNGCDTNRSSAGDDPPTLAESVVEESEQEATPSQPLVLFLGDSLAAGYGVESHQAFPAILKRRLGADGFAFRLINAGVDGDTTATGLNRLAWLLRQNPDILVVELGGNDGLRGQPVSSIQRNLRQIIEAATAKECEVLLLGMRLPPSYGQVYTADFAAVFDRLATEHDLAYIPFFMEGVGGVAGMNLPDQLHPNVAGHERLAENVSSVLKKLLSRVRSN